MLTITDVHVNDGQLIFRKDGSEQRYYSHVYQCKIDEPVAEVFETGHIVYLTREEADMLIARFENVYATERLSFLRQRANRKKIDFNLDYEDMIKINSTQFCELTGVRLTNHLSQSKQYFNTATIDRIDNMQGYVKGNVMVMCQAANRLKAKYEDPNNKEFVKQPPQQLLETIREHLMKNWKHSPQFFA